MLLKQLKLQEVNVLNVSIVPRNVAFEKSLRAKMEAIRPTIKTLLNGIDSTIPIHDVIVTLRANACPDCSDFEIFVETNPNAYLETRAGNICYGIAKVFVDNGFRENSTFKVWLRFIPGSWLLVKNGSEHDTYSHIPK